MTDAIQHFKPPPPPLPLEPIVNYGKPKRRHDVRQQSSTELLVDAIIIAKAAGDLKSALPDALAAAGIVDDETCDAIANRIGRIPHLYKRGLIT